MPASKAQQKAVTKYMKENYDEIKVRVDKGRKDEIKDHAAAVGESVNGYIVEAINRRMEAETPPLGDSAGGARGPQEVTGPGVVSLPPDTLKTAQEAAEAAGEALQQFVVRAVESQAKVEQIGRNYLKRR